MINNIIFDFGNVFMNLDKNASLEALKQLGLSEWDEHFEQINQEFEKGKISEVLFMIELKKRIPNASVEDIRTAWNAAIKDFPLSRLEFLQKLSHKYKLYLLSNIDEIHIAKFEHHVGMTFARAFYQCFEKVYFSSEIGFRKPEIEAFQFILKKHELAPKRTLFVDDEKQNTEIASSLGMHVWHLQIEKEDITALLSKKEIPF
ncbi:Alpha-D-glucose-1-phosphate phosphatase YihX [Flavobacterium columnare]|uniref:HAD family phosphatase n=2 Tax=Flavobacterium TaxID=237 RepID=A0A246GJ56_9FLAO|nr:MULTISPECIES: HAD family phosphatase [Flavobacterium]OWP84246.1 haloacid dehalogenase [Flavobacterium davisii]QYS88477.1 HAD family phosphatase [Flavobacterium davisii]SPE77022.1 Alpha-D-glucose-1-phosphate phosphatase YihX [Flavobacterium columnare]